MSCDGAVHDEAYEEVPKVVDYGDIIKEVNAYDKRNNVSEEEGHEQEEPQQVSPSFNICGSSSSAQILHVRCSSIYLPTSDLTWLACIVIITR